MPTNSSEHSYEIFLAHAGIDVDAARELYRILRGRARVFLDCESLKPTDRYSLIPAIQARCDITAVLVSSRWRSQLYAHEEIALGIHLSTFTQHHQLVAIWLDDVETDHRPYGLINSVGVHLPPGGELNTVADQVLSLLSEARARRDRLSSAVSKAAIDDQLNEHDFKTLTSLRKLRKIAEDGDLHEEVFKNAQDKIINSWIGDRS